MYHLIRRRNINIGFLLVLSAAFFISAVPWIYSNLFVSKEDVVFCDIDNEAPYHKMEYPDKFPDTSMDLIFLNNDYLYSNFRINDLAVGDMKVSGDFFIKGQVIKNESEAGRMFRGKLVSKNIRLNSEPFMKIAMSFDIDKDNLDIQLLRLGKSYELKGKLGLTEPFETDLRLEVIRADIRSLASIARLKTPGMTLAVISGFFKIKGEAKRLFSEGMIESRNGKIGPVEYDFANIRFEGFGPIVNIVDSNIRQDSGTLTMEGHVDLRSIFRGSLFDNLRVRSDMKTIVWDGWDITKNRHNELTMTKDITDNMLIDFKTKTRGHVTTYQDEENPEEMNLKYKVGLENLNLKLKENEEIFGIEHTVKF